jgi:hypothetical protein
MAETSPATRFRFWLWLAAHLAVTVWPIGWSQADCGEA